MLAWVVKQCNSRAQIIQPGTITWEKHPDANYTVLRYDRVFYLKPPNETLKQPYSSLFKAPRSVHKNTADTDLNLDLAYQ